MIVAGAAVPAAAGSDEPNSEAVHALEDGEELYLVFGADLGEMSLEEYIEAHASGEQVSDAEVSQYQDVDQVNINQQANATSISIDGGEATAIQEASQLNSNDQFADAAAENIQGQTTQFEDVGNVYIILGDSDGKQFDGWGIADKKGDKTNVDTDQTAEAVVTQAQAVGQLNYNEQNVAFALAANGSEATAVQQSYQTNQNLQQGVANATNVYVGDGKFADKTGDHQKSGSGPSAGQATVAEVTQGQESDQMNVNEQDGSVAISVGEGSTATAIQFTEQANLNEQLGNASATNVFTSMPGMNVATAGTDGGNTVVDSQKTLEKLEGKEGDFHRKGVGDIQSATSEVTQSQEIEQMNVNLQSTAMAIATNESTATAVQLAHQQNINAQIGHADALNVYAGPGYKHDSVIQSETTSVTLEGGDVDELNGIAYDYDTTQTNDVEQQASAQIEMVQFVTQENVNEQQAAVAVAEDGGSADSAQVTMQENQNLQFGSVAATNVWAAA